MLWLHLLGVAGCSSLDAPREEDHADVQAPSSTGEPDGSNGEQGPGSDGGPNGSSADAAAGTDAGSRMAQDTDTGVPVPQDSPDALDAGPQDRGPGDGGDLETPENAPDAEVDSTATTDAGSRDVEPLDCTADCPLPIRDGLVFWIRADAGVATEGSTVTSWLDQSPTGQKLWTLAGEPQLTQSFNGRAAVMFDGEDDALGINSPIGLPTGANDRTVFLVVRYITSGWGGLVWGRAACNQAFGSTIAPSGVLAVQGWCVPNDYLSSAMAQGAGWILQSVRYHGGKLSHYLAGVAVDSQKHFFETGDERLRLGIELNDNRAVAMEIAEALIFDRALSAEEHAQIVSYLNSHYF